MDVVISKDKIQMITQQHKVNFIGANDYSFVVAGGDQTQNKTIKIVFIEDFCS